MRLSRRDALKAVAVTTSATALAAVTPTQAFAATRPLQVPPQGLRLLHERDLMPDIAFKDGQGQDRGFIEYRGKPVVALFWATWCGVCYGEMPKIDALQARLGDRAAIVPLSIDRAGMPAVKAYYRRRNLTAIKPFLDEERLFASIMAIHGVPTAFVIDPKGRMVAVSEGPVAWDGEAAYSYITSL